MERTQFLYYYRRHKSVNILCGVIVIVLCKFINHGQHLYQVSQKYLERLKSYGTDTILTLTITKGHNSINIAFLVTVLVFGTLSNHHIHGLHLNQVW